VIILLEKKKKKKGLRNFIFNFLRNVPEMEGCRNFHDGEIECCLKIQNNTRFNLIIIISLNYNHLKNYNYLKNYNHLINNYIK